MDGCSARTAQRRADGSGSRRLTSAHHSDTQAAWSPGGRRIAYSFPVYGHPIRFEVRTVRPDGGHKRLIRTIGPFSDLLHPATLSWQPRPE